MKDKNLTAFHHRFNPDGTIDSICLRCFLTAATAENGADIQKLEASHQCANKEPITLTGNLRSLRRS